MLVFVTVGVVSAPAFAQQRIQISDLIQRIDRLETEVVRLRVSQGSGGGDVARLDLFEQELRRLTGLIERFEFESRRAETERAKRLDVMEARLEALERSNTVVSVSPPAAPSFAAEQNFSHEQIPQAAVDPFVTELSPGVQQTEIYQPETTTLQPQTETVFQQPFQPQPEPTNFQSPDVLYDEGIRLLNVGSFDRAGAQFEDLIATYPEDPKAGQAQFWLGDMHFKLGRFEQAATAFLDSFRKWPAGPKAPDSLLKLGMTLANIGKTEEACLSFKQVPARYPGASSTLLRRADIESQRHRCGS